jgi:hypothetical protein
MAAVVSITQAARLARGFAAFFFLEIGIDHSEFLLPWLPFDEIPSVRENQKLNAEAVLQLFRNGVTGRSSFPTA